MATGGPRNNHLTTSRASMRMRYEKQSGGGHGEVEIQVVDEGTAVRDCEEGGLSAMGEA